MNKPRTQDFARLTGLVVVLAAFASAASAVTIPTVPVGNLGNGNDPLTGNLYGGVGYAYNIGTTEVTVGQYTDFLNAVAATDTYALYNTSMGTDLRIAGQSPIAGRGGIADLSLAAVIQSASSRRSVFESTSFVRTCRDTSPVLRPSGEWRTSDSDPTTILERLPCRATQPRRARCISAR
jgi:hypothetical protein